MNSNFKRPDRIGQQGIKPTRIVKRHLAKNSVGTEAIDTSELDTYLNDYTNGSKLASGAVGTQLDLVPFIIGKDVSNASTTNVFNANSPYKMRIIDVWAVSTAASNSGTCTITDGTNTIVTAFSYGTGDKDVARAVEIDDAYHELEANSSLVVTNSSATDDAIVYIMAIKVS